MGEGVPSDRIRQEVRRFSLGVYMKWVTICLTHEIQRRNPVARVFIVVRRHQLQDPSPNHYVLTGRRSA